MWKKIKKCVKRCCGNCWRPCCPVICRKKRRRPLSPKDEARYRYKVKKSIRKFKSNIKVISLANLDLDPWMNDCGSDGTFKIKTDKSQKLVQFIRCYKKSKHWGWAETGVLPRGKTLQIRACMNRQFEGNKHWECSYLFLCKKDVKLETMEQHAFELRSRHKQIGIYGVGWRFHSPHNLKTLKKEYKQPCLK